MDQAKLISMYLYQDAMYHSDSKKDMVFISRMDPTHAANAARLMLMDADKWADDAGYKLVGSPTLWMINLPIWKALYKQATKAFAGPH